MTNNLRGLLAATLLSWAGCMHAEPATLEVAVFPSLDQIVHAALPAWYAMHPDVKIKIVSRNFGDHHKAMLLSMTGQDVEADVTAIEIGHLKAFAESGGLENLAKLPYKGLLYRRKFVDFTFPLAASSKGELTAIPADIAPGTLFFRSDVLDKAGLNEGDLAASWDAYVESGRKIKAATGLYLLQHAADLANMMLRSNLRDGEGAYFDKDNHPVVESPRFIRAFELAKAVREAKLDANVRAWTPEGTKIFQRGLIATHIGGAWFSSYIAALSGMKTGGSWNAADLPGGAFAYMGGTYYAVPKASKNKELAWEFVRFMTLDKANQINAFKVQNAFPALLEALIDPFFDQPLDFLGGQKARLLWREAAYHIPAIRISEYDGLAFELIEEELRKVLENGKDIPTALREVRIALETKIAADMKRAR